jgi:hypothetical protein
MTSFNKSKQGAARHPARLQKSSEAALENISG